MILFSVNWADAAWCVEWTDSGTWWVYVDHTLAAITVSASHSDFSVSDHLRQRYRLQTTDGRTQTRALHSDANLVRAIHTETH